MCTCAAALALTASAAAAQNAATPIDRLRWEMVTNGATPVSTGGTSPTGTPTNLSGTAQDLLFRLDLQPLIKQKNDKSSAHLKFETGVLSTGRTSSATADVAASTAVQSLVQQGAATTTGKAASGTALIQQRAYTFAGEGSMNHVWGADGAGAFAEFGAIARFRYNVFLDDQSISQKDGITYINVPQQDNGFFGIEAGARFRLTQFNQDARTVASSGMSQTSNMSDLLVVEGLYQHDPAQANLTPGASTQHRWVFRSFAYVPVQPTASTDKRDALTFVIGIEASHDLDGMGPKNIRVFYGANVNLKSLF